jgi:hypothetical protein
LEGNVTFQNSCVRPYRFELYRKTRRPAEAARLGVLSFILLAAVVPLHAQQGLPIVQQPGGGTGPSPIVVDASQYWTAGGDACKAIQNAIGQMQTVKNGVVDARAITGDVPCAVNMFGTSNPTGKLLLGNVTIHAQVPQVQPSKFQVEGVGWSPRRIRQHSHRCLRHGRFELQQSGSLTKNPVVLGRGRSLQQLHK